MTTPPSEHVTEPTVTATETAPNTSPSQPLTTPSSSSQGAQSAPPPSGAAETAATPSASLDPAHAPSTTASDVQSAKTSATDDHGSAAVSDGVPSAGQGEVGTTVNGVPGNNSKVASSDTDSADKKGATGDSAPTVVASAARVPTPSSRTSTPPLITHAAKKKFSSVSVTKEFLSKAASPTPAPAKLVRPAAAPAPTHPTSKLLSTKLTTVPSSKATPSPKPPTATASSTGSSPWAKPAVPIADSSAATPLQHPAPTRGGPLPNVAMGSGQGLGSNGRRAWGPVTGSEGRRGGMGISRDFPTAKEVADSHRKAQLSAQAIAQAEAAHNQAILDDLNTFTHLEPNAHRWDEEDEDDDVIDFGDGRTYRSSPHPSNDVDKPVGKQERFADDFDRSWPAKDNTGSRHEQGRVLFNASSNRLEPTSSRGGGLQQHQSSRPGGRGAPSAHSGHDRGLPPHMEDSGRMLPPHMAMGTTSGGSSQSGWRAASGERQPPPHLLPDRREARHDPPMRIAATRPPPVPRPTHAPPSPTAQAPSAATVGALKAPEATTETAPPASAAPAEQETGESQAAEMHTAAEKARQRRMAEEAEREAAAERARQKARELAERFGPSKQATTAPVTSAPPAPPPGLSKPPPPPPGLEKAGPQATQVTIATRPKPEQHGGKEIGAPPGLPQPPEGGVRAADRASSWRRTEPLPEHQETRSKGRRPSQDHGHAGNAGRDLRRNMSRDAPPHPNRDVVLPQLAHGLPPIPGRDTNGAPSSPTRTKAAIIEHARAHGLTDHIAAPHPSKREANIDTMLARLQAAMAKARVSPDEQMSGSHGPTAEAVQILTAAASAGVAPLAPPSVKPKPQVEAETHSSASPVASKQSKPAKAAAPAPSLPNLPPEYFDATQIEPPPSPPPAWRLYTVKLPKSTYRNRGSIPRSRLKAAEAPRTQGPKGWAMSFDPPVNNLAPSGLISDTLLPQPIGRRFAKQIDTGPIISISPRQLTMFRPKPKQRSGDARGKVGDARGIAVTGRSVPESAQTEPPMLSPPSSKRSSGGKLPPTTSTSAAAITTNAHDKAPGVRFMVSSELDGDSLLDEINKMSLEHIGEADDKNMSVKPVEREKPGTPPRAAPVPSVRTNPTSPSTQQGPWAKSALAYPVTSPARDSAQRERLKSVWEQAATDTPTTTAPTPASAPMQPEAPLYPTLNSPATAPDPGSLKPGYQLSASSTPFGARGQFGQGYGQFVGSGGMGSGATSPDGGMGVQFGVMGRTPSGAASTNGFQQGVWAPSFGNSMTTSGYGYNGNGAKGSHDQQQKSGMGGFGKDNGSFGADFRYTGGQGTPGMSAQAQAHAQAQAQAAAAAAAGYQGTSGGAAYNGYSGGAGQYRSPQSLYGVGTYGAQGGHGFGTQMAGPRASSSGASRFPPSMGNGAVDYQAMGYDPSNYYSSSAQAFGPSGGYGGQQAGGRAGGPGRKMW